MHASQGQILCMSWGEEINVIMEEPSQAIGSPPKGVSLGQVPPTLNISRSVRLPELLGLWRTFIKLTGGLLEQGTGKDLNDDDGKLEKETCILWD